MLQYNKVFKASSKFTECSSETETPIITHSWLGRTLGKQISFESVLKTP